MNAFLRLKHWQLFLLIVGLPIVFQACVVATISNMELEENFFSIFRFFPIVLAIAMCALFSWFWAIGVGLQKLVPEGVKMKVMKFKVLLLITTTYFAAIICLISVLLFGMNQEWFRDTFSLIPGVTGVSIGIVVFLHFLSMFGMFYSIYFVAKTLKTVELQREVRFSEFAGEFVLIWMYFVGIWFLQPKINELAEESNHY